MSHGSIMSYIIWLDTPWLSICLPEVNIFIFSSLMSLPVQLHPDIARACRSLFAVFSLCTYKDFHKSMSLFVNYNNQFKAPRIKRALRWSVMSSVCMCSYMSYTCTVHWVNRQGFRPIMMAIKCGMQWLKSVGKNNNWSTAQWCALSDVGWGQFAVMTARKTDFPSHRFVTTPPAITTDAFIINGWIPVPTCKYSFSLRENKAKKYYQ